MSQTLCAHESDEDGQITGTWCTPEMEVALSHGDRVKTIHSVYHSEQRTPRLFAEYVDTFLKTKAEAPGNPPHITTEEQKVKYVREYIAREGILLDRANIEKNPGMRSLSKLCFSSFWGRLGMQDSK